MLNTANIYVDLLNKIKESGGAVPPELVEEVEALNVTVNGDETTDPPTVGLVDIVADLGDEVEDLDIDINGDDTTEPPTPGLKDRVGEIETTINGDTTTTPETPGLVDRVTSIESQLNDVTFDTADDLSGYVSTAYTAPCDGYVRITGSSGGVLLGDGADSYGLLTAPGSASDYNSLFVKKGTRLSVLNSTTAIFLKLTHS